MSEEKEMKSKDEDLDEILSKEDEKVEKDDEKPDKEPVKDTKKKSTKKKVSKKKATKKRPRIQADLKVDDPVREFLIRHQNRNLSHAQLVLLYAMEQQKKAILPSEYNKVPGYMVNRDIGVLLRYIDEKR